MALLKHEKKGKNISPASNRRRPCLSGSSERPDRCQRRALSTCVAPPTKKVIFRRFFAQIYDWKHLYLHIFLVSYDIPSFCHNPSHTSDPIMHHPVMDSLVLSQQQCGKATAVFVPSKDCDIVAEDSKCSSSGLDLIFFPLNVVPAGWI